MISPGFWTAAAAQVDHAALQHREGAHALLLEHRHRCADLLQPLLRLGDGLALGPSAEQSLTLGQEDGREMLAYGQRIVGLTRYGHHAGLLPHLTSLLGQHVSEHGQFAALGLMPAGQGPGQRRAESGVAVLDGEQHPLADHQVGGDRTGRGVDEHAFGADRELPVLVFPLDLLDVADQGRALDVDVRQRLVEPLRASTTPALPSRASTAGTSVIRTRNASTNTPTARPSAIGLIVEVPSRDEGGEDRDHDDRGRGHHPGTGDEAGPDGVLGRRAPWT